MNEMPQITVLQNGQIWTLLNHGRNTLISKENNE